MIREKDIIADLHVHTVASLHAYSTLDENLKWAKKAGMQYIAVTDHFFRPAEEIARKNELYRIRYMERNVNPHTEIKVIGSAEFNILQDTEYRDEYAFLKWRPVGLHESFVPGLSSLTYDDLLEGFKEAAGWCVCFDHIERELDRLSYGRFKNGLTNEAKAFLEKLVLLAGEKQIFLEVNEHSLEPGRQCGQFIPYWLEIAAQNGNRFCLGSDAHFCREVGKFDRSIELLNKFGVKKSKVLNCDADEVKIWLQKD